MLPDRATEDQIVARVREAEAERSEDISPGLWARVESGLPDRVVAPGRLRVAHASRSRMRRLLAVAAILLAVIGLTWQLADRNNAQGTLVSDRDIQRTLKRRALEGPLELDGRSRPLGRDLYRGVAVKEGTLATNVLRACSPC